MTRTLAELARRLSRGISIRREEKCTRSKIDATAAPIAVADGKFWFALGLACLFFFSQAPPVAAGQAVTRQELLFSIPTPVQKVALISVIRLVKDNEVVGEVALYDDPGTDRPVDYIELFNRAGDLLAFAWFDRFGIERTAVDRGLLRAAQKPEGVFVILVEGRPI